mgnify:CR=1 FL=1
MPRWARVKGIITEEEVKKAHLTKNMFRAKHSKPAASWQDDSFSFICGTHWNEDRLTYNLRKLNLKKLIIEDIIH